MTDKIPSNLDPANEEDAKFLTWLNHNWERCKPFLQLAVDRAEGGFDLEYAWSLIMDGRAQLWPGDRCAVVTKIELYPSGIRSAFCWLAGGDLGELSEIEGRIATWAKNSEGCSRVEIIGRRGWAKKLQGFREVGTILTKEI